MATPVFVPGYSQAATFKLDGQGAAVTLNITSHSWSEQVKDLITTHSGSGGIAARIAGILDGEGTIEANFDSANIVHAGANAVVAGAKGVMTFAVGTTNPFSVHAMVKKINWKSTVDGLVVYNLDAAIDSSSGSYTRAS